MVVESMTKQWKNRSYRWLGRLAFLAIPVMSVAIIVRPDTTLLGSIAAAMACTAVGGIVWAALSPMEVRLIGDEVIVINPFRATTRIPVAEIDSIGVTTCLEFHLRDEDIVRAWGVEPANITRILHRESWADRAAQEIRDAIAAAVPSNEPVALPSAGHAARVIALAVAGSAVCGGAVYLLAH